ncbi:MAG: biotin--[acetyl-CoA-carboxylase] ligase [Alphaproteobacteria bacterium]|nr:biotin--[acetyl-CoA-carboxylase] ligase [Alphaproteobacteria bacterium]
MNMVAPEAGSDRPDLPPAYRLVALDSVDSTNEHAKALAEEGAEDGTLIWALEQTSGRGRMGRDWSSPPGNLYCSLVLRPDCDLATAAELGFVAALGVGDALGQLVPPMTELHFKWPNDVLLEGRKVCGILLEASASSEGALDYVILGVGLNIASRPPSDQVRAEPISLYEVGCGPDVTPVSVLSSFSRHFLVWVNRWLDDGFAPVRSAWLNRAKGVGEEISVTCGTGGETLQGVFSDLDPHGALVLDVPGRGFVTVTAGEVYFPAQAE